MHYFTRKLELKIKPDKHMKRRNHEFQFIDKVTCCKWLNWRPITMLFSSISGMQSTSTVQRWMKRSATKILVPCPDVIKMYNQGMGGIGLVDQRTSACISNFIWWMQLVSRPSSFAIWCIKTTLTYLITKPSFQPI